MLTTGHSELYDDGNNQGGGGGGSDSIVTAATTVDQRSKRCSQQSKCTQKPIVLEWLSACNK